MARKGKCSRGHDMTPDNTYTRKDGFTYCRECNREDCRRYYERQRRKKLKETINAPVANV